MLITNICDLIFYIFEPILATRWRGSSGDLGHPESGEIALEGTGSTHHTVVKVRRV
jgi:hypothetical protein